MVLKSKQFAKSTKVFQNNTTHLCKLQGIQVSMDRVSIGSIVPKYTDSIFQDNTTILIQKEVGYSVIFFNVVLF